MSFRKNFDIVPPNKRLPLNFKTAFLSALSVAILGGVPTLRAQILDNFSTNTSADYDVVSTFGTASSYGISGGQFIPVSHGQGSTNFLRNTGESLSSLGGGTVSINLNAVDGNDSGIGLSFATNAATGANGFGLVVQYLPADPSKGYHLTADQNNTSLSALGLTLATPALISVTRETADPTLFQYTISGGGLAAPYNGLLSEPGTSGLPVFFGMGNYYADSTGGNAVSNLSFSPAPEPSTWAMMAFGGLVGMLFIVRRRSSQA